MRVRTVDQDFNGNQLELFWGGNGDVYVTIYENESSEEARDNPIGRPVTVRVGMGKHLLNKNYSFISKNIQK